MDNPRLMGQLAIGLGLVVFLGCAAVSVVSSLTTDAGSIGGAVLGVVGGLLIAIFPIGGGIYLLSRGRAEAGQQADAARRRQILDMVKAKDQVYISDIAVETNSETRQIREDVYKLVGLGVFSGYINWDEGVLYSRAAAQLAGNTCPNCGGEQEFAGKGVIQCKYCGSEIFLS